MWLASLPRAILTMTLGGRYYPHFTDEGTEARGLSNLFKVAHLGQGRPRELGTAASGEGLDVSPWRAVQALVTESRTPE